MVNYFYICSKEDEKYSDIFERLGCGKGDRDNLIAQVKGSRNFCKDELAISYGYFIQSIKASTVIYIKNDSENVLGCCAISINSPYNINIYSICVPDRGVKGIGTALIDKIKELSNSLGLISIDLLADQSTQTFYLKNGFKFNDNINDNNSDIDDNDTYDIRSSMMIYTLSKGGIKTRKSRKSKQNKTKKDTNSKKNIIPLLKYLKINYPLYASKKHEGDKLLEYKRKAEIESGDHCLLENSSWFGNLDVAKSYKQSDTQIYKWKIKTPTYLLKIDKKNELFIEHIFKNTNMNLTPTIHLTETQIKKIKYEHVYINMSPNEKALYEFKFAFGYITVEEQYEFLNLIKYLIENKFIKIETRVGNSILKKLNFKLNYYNASVLFTKKKKYNRLSFYFFDKYAIMNLCKIVYHKKEYKISGVYQKNDTSFWFPDLIVYKMNIQEYILFNPSHNLIYDKMIK